MKVPPIKSGALPQTDAEAIEQLRLYWGRNYSRGEVVTDAIVHTLAIVLGLAGFSGLISHVAQTRSTGELLAVLVYAFGFFAMLGCSLTYNIWPMSRTKLRLRRFDHSAIYIMIAGTCTAFLSQIESDAWRMALITTVWAGALTGVAAKMFAPGRYEGPLLALYLGLGWVCAIGIVPIYNALPTRSLILLVIGGAIYTAGVLFYRWEELRYHNAIWHGFVAVAAACHFVGVSVAMGAGSS